MRQFWFTVIEPVFSLLQPRVIVEIGSSTGRNTAHLLEYCRRHDATLHAIDPKPDFDVAAWRTEHGERFVLHQAKSLDALSAIGAADVYLIDGDHNWYTVYHELGLIDRIARDHGRPFPLTLLHDIGWPYGRRDLYYDPDDIPDEFRHPYQRSGLVPGSNVLQRGGLNADACNATTENDPRNGVLTAIEDFLAQREEPLDFVRLHGFHGLGILVPQTTTTRHPKLEAFLRRTGNSHRLLAEHLRALEDERLTTLLRLEKLKRQKEKWRGQRPSPTQDEPEAAKVDRVRGGRTARSKGAASPLAGPSSDPAVAAERTLDRADVVVCVHDALEDVETCIDSVLRHTAERHRLVLVDDGSGPECRDYLAEVALAQPRVLLLRSEEATGFTKAANRGLRAVVADPAADAAVLLNSDTVVTPGWLEAMLEGARSSPKVGLVGPLSNYGAHQSVPQLPYLAEGAKNNPLPPGWDPDRVAEAVAALSPRAFPRVPLLDGFCVLLTRAVIEAVGLLDEENFPQGYAELFDYCLRAVAAGFELVVADHAYVYHAGTRSYGEERRRLLVESTNQALRRKYGRVRLRESRDFFINEPTLAAMRETLGARLSEATSPSQDGSDDRGP